MKKHNRQNLCNEKNILPKYIKILNNALIGKILYTQRLIYISFFKDRYIISYLKQKIKQIYNITQKIFLIFIKS